MLEAGTPVCLLLLYPACSWQTSQVWLDKCVDARVSKHVHIPDVSLQASLYKL